MALPCIIISPESSIPDRIQVFLESAKIFEVERQCKTVKAAVAAFLDGKAEFCFLELELAAEMLAAVKSFSGEERPRLVMIGSEEIYCLDRQEIEPVLFDPNSLLPARSTVSKQASEGHSPRKDLAGASDLAVAVAPPMWNLEEVRDQSVAPQPLKDAMFVRTDDGIKRLRREDLLVVEAQKDYLLLTARKASFRVLRSLKSLEARLDPTVHCRVHRSYIVQISAIHSLDQDMLWVDGVQEAIPIGPNYRKELFARLEII